MNSSNIITVSNGLVAGTIKNIFGKDIIQFLSIPYCKPPVGTLRFQRPQPCDSFSDQIINKSDFHTCQLQSFVSSPLDKFLNKVLGSPLENQEEDSLYVNIWCPLDILSSNAKQPVFIYIHGGAFFLGSSSIETYDGSILASQENIIVVSFNYRLNIAGFLCLDDFIKGNMGIWDQVLAMKWIYDNISAFNGDPENMTLGGFSAGAASVSLHLIIEESWPHFSKAVIHSGVCLADWACLPKEELVRRSVIWVNKILEKYKYPVEWSSSLTNAEKRSIIEYLQSMNLNEFVNQFDVYNAQVSLIPCIDGELIKEYPKNLFESGRFKKCPTIIQNTLNEGSMFLLSQSPSIGENNQIQIQYLANSFTFFPYHPIRCTSSTMDKIKSEYHIWGDTISVSIFDRIMSDKHFVCPSIELANIISRFNEAVYFLLYSVLYHASSEGFDIPTWMGVFHGSDVNPFFGNYLKPKFESADSDKTFSIYLMGQYGCFIKNGNLPEKMPYYETKSKKIISIEKEGMISKVLSNDQYDKVTFWRNLRKACE